VTVHSLFIAANCPTCFGHGPVPDAVNTVICAPDDGWCHRPKHLEQFAAINNLYRVASHWTTINIDLRCADL